MWVRVGVGVMRLRVRVMGRLVHSHAYTARRFFWVQREVGYYTAHTHTTHCHSTAAVPLSAPHLLSLVMST